MDRIKSNSFHFFQLFIYYTSFLTSVLLWSINTNNNNDNNDDTTTTHKNRDNEKTTATTITNKNNSNLNSINHEIQFTMEYIQSKLSHFHSLPSHMAIIINKDDISHLVSSPPSSPVSSSNNDSHGTTTNSTIKNNSNNHIDMIKKYNKRNYQFHLKLGDIILWSMISGLNRLTILDPTGFLKNNIDVLETIVSHKQSIYQLHNITLNWLNNQNNKSTNHHHNNNQSNHGRILNISIVSIEDGKQQLVDITKKYIKDKRINNNLKLDTDYVNSNLPSHIGGKDYEPEVAIDFSDRFMYAGYLPWHLKLTEFIKMDNFMHFHIGKFINVIKKYGKIEKRCGK